MRKNYFAYRGIISGIIGFGFLSHLIMIPPREINLMGILLILLSILLRVWARGYILDFSRESKIKTDILLVEGPYSVTRNPLYLSSIMFGMGVLIYSGLGFLSGLFFLWLIATHYYILIRIEAKELELMFPKQYKEYSRSTPLLIGFFKYKKGGRNQSWIKAFKKDLWTWIWKTLVVALVSLT